MATRRARTSTTAAPDVDVVLDACRALVAISARSVEAVAGRVDLVQLRILVVLARRETASLRDVVDATGLHPTRASRHCDRLVAKKFITRTDDPDDRRVLRLALAPAGHKLVRRVVDARRDAIAPALAAMSATRRAELVRSLRAFTVASGEHGATDADDLSTLAWVENTAL